MTQLIIDNMDNAGSWTGLAPDGVTASLELSINDNTSHFRFGDSGTSGFVSGGSGALFHTLTRSLPDVDLTDYDQLHLAVNADRMADGSPVHPFYLEIRLGSASMGLSNPGNTWIRYLPVFRQNYWESIRLSLEDLPAPIRSAVNIFQIRCVDAGAVFGCYIDQILVIKEEMLRDVDSAIEALIHNQFSIGGSPVPCELHVAGTTPLASLPYILATQYRLCFSGERTTETRTRGDFNPDGYRLKTKVWAYDLFYSIEVMADGRADQAVIMAFVLSVLPPMGELVINGNPVPYEMTDPKRLNDSIAYQEELPLIHYRILARQEIGTPRIVQSAESVVLSVDAKVA